MNWRMAGTPLAGNLPFFKTLHNNQNQEKGGRKMKQETLEFLKV